MLGPIQGLAILWSKRLVVLRSDRDQRVTGSSIFIEKAANFCQLLGRK